MAAAVASLLLAANLLAFWHQATVAHARCAEHGELIHGAADGDDYADADAAPRAAEVDDAVVRLVARGAGAGDADDDHDHCEICPLTRDGLRFEPPVQVATPVLRVAVAVTPPVERDIVVAIDLVRVAPKTSPPV
jgi:hypothetical protein